MLSAFVDEQRLRGLSVRTIDRRRWSIGLFETHCRGRGRELATATTDDVESWLVRYSGVQTRASLLCDLRQLYRCGLRRGLVGSDITVGVPAPRIPKRGASPVPWDDVERVMQRADRATRGMILLAVYAGLRCSEIAHLRGEDVRLDHRLIVVRQGKGGKDATVPLAVELAGEFASWTRSGALFPGHDGQKVGWKIRRAMRAVGVLARPHDLRHSFGTQVAIKTNGNMVLTAQLMRHENVASTERYVRWNTTGLEVVSGLYSPAA